MIGEQIGLMIQVIATLFIMSFIIKENALYRLAEHIFVGVAVGFSVILALRSIYSVGVINIVENGQISLIIAFILGLMLYLRYNKSTEVWYRWPIALLIGVGTALSITAGIDAYFIKQIRDTILPLNTIDNIAVFLSTILSLAYFFFTIPQTSNTSKGISKLGRYTLMIGFGVSYAGILSSRMVLIIDRITFVVKTLLGL